MANNPNPQAIGWICKGLEYHSKGIAAAGPQIVVPTLPFPDNWGDEKRDAFGRGGAFQLQANPLGHRCTFADYVVT